MTTLRPAVLVMHLPRMGAFHQTRLSFMRSLLRDIAKTQVRFTRKLWDINKDGEGSAVYEIRIGKHIYSLAAYGHNLPPEKRSDRVIAEEWDATFTLVNGEVSAQDAEAMRPQVAKQEAGRQNNRQLVLSRANRSVRLFDYVVDSLARGMQPARTRLDEVGYLMRTTAVYANGKFGVCGRDSIATRPQLRAPFRAEMLAVWLFRTFAADMAEHLAKMRAPHKAIALSAANRRRLGIGNATGLGMAPFLINHPRLLHKWMCARETALARVRAIETIDERGRFLAAAKMAKTHTEQWQTNDKTQSAKIAVLCDDINAIIKHAAKKNNSANFWNALYQWGEAHLSLEGLEMLVSLLLEPFGEVVDDLADTMSAAAPKTHIDGTTTIATMRALLQKKYHWALAQDFSAPDAAARFWYVSADKMEPRLGECATDDGMQKQLPLVIARDMHNFYAALCADDKNKTLAAFLHHHPQYRHNARRALANRASCYGEIRANLASGAMLPLDMLRCKLSFFGATRFDPRSDRWLRITMYQNAPQPNDYCGGDDWIWR